MKETRYCDVLIVGGGINGCGIAADAASRGLKVILCEKNDLSSGTSSASSKLIHGGLRYLEQYDFSLVKKAIKEREVLFKVCPYLIKPLQFVLPHKKKIRSYWLIRLGLFIYDFLSYTSLPKSTSVTRKKDHSLFDFLTRDIEKGLSYYDGQTMDCRLVLVNALQAKKFGAEILTRTELITSKREKDYWQSELKNNQSTIEIKSQILVNATGPWAEKFNQQIKITTPYHLSLVQGSHLVVDKLYEGDFAFILQNQDKRIVFTIPYHDKFTLIGTTDLLFNENLNQCKVTDKEISYLLALTNQYFKKKLIKSDIKHSFCGLRPLIKSRKRNSVKNISRDYKIYFDTSLAPYACIFGGKLTTYRVLAKECVDRWKSLFPNMKPCQTDTLLLPGASTTSPEILFKNLKRSYAQLPEKLLAHYLSLYGDRARKLLINCSDLISLGQYFGGMLYQKEIDFLIENEWAKTVEDIIWRRTQQGLFMNTAQIERLNKYLVNKS